jgi:hypothetical protein
MYNARGDTCTTGETAFLPRCLMYRVRGRDVFILVDEHRVVHQVLYAGRRTVTGCDREAQRQSDPIDSPPQGRI